MEILRFLTPNEPIAGLEISESALRLVLLEEVEEKIEEKPKEKTVASLDGKPPSLVDKPLSSSGKGKKDTSKNKEKSEKKFSLAKFKKARVLKVKSAAEWQLEPGVIENGILKNPQVFSESLTRLLKKSKISVRYVIVSFSVFQSYTKLFTFPNVIEDQKLSETMRLMMGFQMPVKTEEYYFDWEKHDGTEKKEVLLSGASRKVVEDYLNALHSAGLRSVAVEFSPASVARALNEDATVNTLLLVILNRGSFSLSVLKHGIIHFTRYISFNVRDFSTVTQEARKVIDFYESENHAHVERILVVDQRFEEKKGKNKKEPWPLPASFAEAEVALVPQLPANAAAFLPALGAARRGVTPRSLDRQISLMAISTETAYEAQKAEIFSQLISHLIISFAVFFAIIVVGIWVFATSILGSKSEQISKTSANALKGGVELRAKAGALNAVLKEDAAVARTIPRWSLVVQEIKNRAGAGIVIHGLSLPTPEATFAITGVASDRENLRKFEKALKESPLFAGVDLPVSNINMKNDIPFSVSLKLKNPGEIYFK